MTFGADTYRKDDPDRKFLQSREWRERIRPQHLSREPLCRFCRALGRYEPARHVDHIERPRGDRRLQRHTSNHQSLCVDCHGKKSAWERMNERNGTKRTLVIGRTADGWHDVHAPGGTIELASLVDAQPMASCNSIANPTIASRARMDAGGSLKPRDGSDDQPTGDCNDHKPVENKFRTRNDERLS